jgi:hypothetical protein
LVIMVIGSWKSVCYQLSIVMLVAVLQDFWSTTNRFWSKKRSSPSWSHIFISSERVVTILRFLQFILFIVFHFSQQISKKCHKNCNFLFYKQFWKEIMWMKMTSHIFSWYYWTSTLRFSLTKILLMVFLSTLSTNIATVCIKSILWNDLSILRRICVC